MPEAVVAGARRSPGWPVLESVAHTTAYDLTTTGTAPDLGAVDVPVLVLDSASSDARLRAWADGVAARLPNATRRTLPNRESPTSRPRESNAQDP
ncbi:hypothetical protein [Saccharothrix sp. Mg75]|uniref:hypothetical protein n=1 Tax=Saccharothrix sp. Mg75 TaxID=3445357 RepID=UPI003EF087FD